MPQGGAENITIETPGRYTSVTNHRPWNDPPTRRQREVLRFLEAFILNHGYPPTRQEITDAFGWRSPNAAQEVLRALQKKGRIKLAHNIARGIVLVTVA